MGDSAMVVVAIFLAAILMFVFPLMTMADKKDDVSTLAIQSMTTEFTDSIRVKGKITREDYDNFEQALAATGNAYDVDIRLQILDDNTAKVAIDAIGDNRYYSVYKVQIMNSLPLSLKEGDIITVDVTNTNTTIGGQIRNFLYKVTGNNISTITASSSGIVTVNGD